MMNKDVYIVQSSNLTSLSIALPTVYVKLNNTLRKPKYSSCNPRLRELLWTINGTWIHEHLVGAPMTWMCQGGDTTCSAWSLRERARYGRWAAAETDRRSERWIYICSKSRSVVDTKVGGDQCIAGPVASKFGGPVPPCPQPLVSAKTTR